MKTRALKKVRVDIFGRYCRNPCGFCFYHKKLLTVKQLKAKRCLQKECGALYRYQTHPFWAQREKVKELRDERKREKDAYYNNHTHRVTSPAGNIRM